MIESMADEPSRSHQPIVFETGGPVGAAGGSTVSDLAADSADGCLIRVYSETQSSRRDTCEWPLITGLFVFEPSADSAKSNQPAHATATQS